MSGVSKTVRSRVIEMLSRRPSALLTDVDGTLSRIVPRPEDASVEPEISRSLEALRSKIDLIAVITARPQAVARKMVGVEGLTYVGHYGLLEDTSTAWPEIERAKLHVRPLIRSITCASFEDKGISFAVHFRNCAEPETVRTQLFEMLAPVAAEAGAKLVEGKKVLEVVPREVPDKGSAVRMLQKQHGLNGIVYLGDDIGDLIVYQELKRRAREDGLPSLGIAVVDAEADPRILAAADLTLQGVDGVRELLEALVEAPELARVASNA